MFASKKSNFPLGILIFSLFVSVMPQAIAGNPPTSIPGKSPNPKCSTSSNSSPTAKVSVVKNLNKDCVQLQTDLVGLWNFEGSNLGADTSGFYNLTPQSDPSQLVLPLKTSQGKYGSGLHLQQGAYLGLFGTVQGLPAGNASYTYSAWINPDGQGSPVGGILAYGRSGNNLSNSLRLNGWNGIWHYWYNNDFGFNVANSLVGNWSHIASTYDSITGERKLYLNGNLMNTDTPNNAPDFISEDLLIGKTTADSTFSGTLDEVALFRSALTQVQISQVMLGNYG